MNDTLSESTAATTAFYSPLIQESIYLTKSFIHRPEFGSLITGEKQQNLHPFHEKLALKPQPNHGYP